MTRINSKVVLAGPIEEVFNYLTSAANWHYWHPATLAVNGAINYSADPGEEIVEHIRVGLKRDRVVWTVINKAAPAFWEFHGLGDAGGRAKIIYRLSKQPGGTLFMRELSYRMPNLLLTILDKLALQFYMRHQTAKALGNLRKIFEIAATGPASQKPSLL